MPGSFLIRAFRFIPTTGHALLTTNAVIAELAEPHGPLDKGNSSVKTVTIDLVNCYGIRKLQETFDFSTATSLTLTTLASAAAALGRQVKFELCAI